MEIKRLVHIADNCTSNILKVIQYKSWLRRFFLRFIFRGESSTILLKNRILYAIDTKSVTIGILLRRIIALVKIISSIFFRIF